MRWKFIQTYYRGIISHILYLKLYLSFSWEEMGEFWSPPLIFNVNQGKNLSKFSINSQLYEINSTTVIKKKSEAAFRKNCYFT